MLHVQVPLLVLITVLSHVSHGVSVAVEVETQMLDIVNPSSGHIMRDYTEIFVPLTRQLNSVYDHHKTMDGRIRILKRKRARNGERK